VEAEILTGDFAGEKMVGRLPLVPSYVRRRNVVKRLD
jgi:hypothetical protein